MDSDASTADVICTPVDTTPAPSCAPLSRLIFRRDQIGDSVLSPSADGNARIGVQVPSGGVDGLSLAVELARDGEVVGQYEAAGAYFRGGAVWRDAARARLIGAADVEPRRLEWLGDRAVLLDLDARWPEVADSLRADNIVFDGSVLWMARAPTRADLLGAVLHRFSSDGDEDTPSDGVRIGSFYDGSIALGPDGSAWLVADADSAGGTSEAEEIELRAINISPDGEIARVSAPLASRHVLGNTADGRSYIVGIWASATDDAYFVHFVGYAAGRAGFISRIVRVGFTGTVDWRLEAELGWSAYWRGRLSPLIGVHDGGLAALLGEAGDWDSMRIWSIAFDGTSETVPIAPPDEPSLQGPYSSVALDVSARGRLFVAATVEGSTNNWVDRFSLDGEGAWQHEGLDCHFGLTTDDRKWLQLRNDGDGGVWILATVNFVGSRVQHLSSDGRPLYHEIRRVCAEDPDRQLAFRHEAMRD